MLSFQISTLHAADWARQTFIHAPLGDRRRSERAASLAAAMALQPGRSIPAMCLTIPTTSRPAYTFLDRPEATPDRLQQPHRDAVAQRLATPGQTFVLLEDTTEMSWAGHQPVAGLGPIGLGSEGLQGFLLHSSLAVAWPQDAAGLTRRPPLELLGLADQIYHVRTPRPAGEKRGRVQIRIPHGFLASFVPFGSVIEPAFQFPGIPGRPARVSFQAQFRAELLAGPKGRF